MEDAELGARCAISRGESCYSRCWVSARHGRSLLKFWGTVGERESSRPCLLPDNHACRSRFRLSHQRRSMAVERMHCAATGLSGYMRATDGSLAATSIVPSDLKVGTVLAAGTFHTVAVASCSSASWGQRRVSESGVRGSLMNDGTREQASPSMGVGRVPGWGRPGRP